LHVDASDVQLPVSMTGTSAPPLESPAVPPLDEPELLLAVESPPPPASWLLGAGLLLSLLLLQP
jgi:hypothetical protein